MDNLSPVVPGDDYCTVTLIRSSALEESSDPRDQQSEVSVGDSFWLPNDHLAFERHRGRKSTRQRQTRARTTTQAAKILKPRRNKPKSTTSGHNQLQNEYGKNFHDPTAYGTMVSTQLGQQKASTAAVTAVDLLQHGHESATVRATIQASDGGIAARGVPTSHSEIDQCGQGPVFLIDEAERLLILLDRQYRYAPLHRDILNAFESISELIQHAVDRFIKMTGFHSVSTGSLTFKALDLCRVLAGGVERNDVRTRTATVTSQAIVTARHWIEACAFAYIFQSVFLEFDTNPPAAVQQWMSPFLNRIHEGRRLCTYNVTEATKSADSDESISSSNHLRKIPDSIENFGA